MAEKEKPKLGRPPREFTDVEIAKIEQMALDNCHTETIARTLGTTDETIKEHFSPLLKQKRAEGRALLRRSQREKAVIGKDTGMLCFLGKNELEQTDKQTITHTFDWRSLTKDGSDSTANQG